MIRTTYFLLRLRCGCPALWQGRVPWSCVLVLRGRGFRARPTPSVMAEPRPPLQLLRVTAASLTVGSGASPGPSCAGAQGGNSSSRLLAAAAAPWLEGRERAERLRWGEKTSLWVPSGPTP